MALGRCAVKYEPLNEPTNEQLMALGLAMSNRIASTTTVKAPPKTCFNTVQSPPEYPFKI